MNTCVQSLCASLTTLLAACNMQQPSVSLPAIGPVPIQEFTGSGKPGEGYLVVYPRPDWLAADYYGHSHYTVLADDGEPILQVRNRQNRFGSGPTHVPLPAGSDLIKGQLPGAREMMVRVVTQRQN